MSGSKEDPYYKDLQLLAAIVVCWRVAYDWMEKNGVKYYATMPNAELEELLKNFELEWKKKCPQWKDEKPAAICLFELMYYCQNDTFWADLNQVFEQKFKPEGDDYSRRLGYHLNELVYLLFRYLYWRILRNAHKKGRKKLHPEHGWAWYWSSTEITGMVQKAAKRVRQQDVIQVQVNEIDFRDQAPPVVAELPDQVEFQPEGLDYEQPTPEKIAACKEWAIAEAEKREKKHEKKGKYVRVWEWMENGEKNKSQFARELESTPHYVDAMKDLLIELVLKYSQNPKEEQEHVK